MGWEWRPETPEEIAEHQRMRRELIESRQMYDDKIINLETEHKKKKRKPRSVLVIILVVILLLYLLYNGGFSFLKLSNDQPSAISATENLLENENSVHLGVPVSKSAANYLQLEKAVVLKCNDLFVKLQADFQDGSDVADYTVYSADIDSLLTKINRLQEQSIYRFDPLKDFQKVCELYYGRVYSFFLAAKQQQKIDLNGYIQLSVELNSLVNPFECLVKLLDENGYYYYIDSENCVHYKYQNSIF